MFRIQGSFGCQIFHDQFPVNDICLPFFIDRRISGDSPEIGLQTASYGSIQPIRVLPQLKEHIIDDSLDINAVCVSIQDLTDNRSDILYRVNRQKVALYG